EDWIQTGEIVAAKDCTAYVAIMVVNMEGKRTITEAQQESLIEDGWKVLNEPFENGSGGKRIGPTPPGAQGRREVALALQDVFLFQGARGLRVQIASSCLTSFRHAHHPTLPRTESADHAQPVLFRPLFTP